MKYLTLFLVSLNICANSYADNVQQLIVGESINSSANAGKAQWFELNYSKDKNDLFNYLVVEDVEKPHYLIHLPELLKGSTITITLNNLSENDYSAISTLEGVSDPHFKFRKVLSNLSFGVISRKFESYAVEVNGFYKQEDSFIMIKTNFDVFLPEHMEIRIGAHLLGDDGKEENDNIIVVKNPSTSIYYLNAISSKKFQFSVLNSVVNTSSPYPDCFKKPSSCGSYTL
jgi:hypothetical protein